MARPNLTVLGFWLVAALFVITGVIIMVRGKSGGAVYLALSVVWMILAMAQAKKSKG